MKQYLYNLGLVLVLAVWVPVLPAQTPPAVLLSAAQGGIPWSALSPEEQKLLRPHYNKWHNYAPQHQQQLREGVHRYLQLSPPEQQQLDRIRGEYQRKSPEERERLREIYRSQHRGR